MNIECYERVNYIPKKSIHEQLQIILSNDNYELWTKTTVGNLYVCACGKYGIDAQLTANNLLNNFVEYVTNKVVYAGYVKDELIKMIDLSEYARKCIKYPLQKKHLPKQ